MKINYVINLQDEQLLNYELVIDDKTCLLERKANQPTPEWALLQNNQCPNCTLSSADYPYCPIATNIAGIIEDCAGMISHSAVELKVITKQRTISASTNAQKAISSLLGLVMASSDCPHTAFFRPMAHFHLPLASQEESLYRAISSFLLLHFFASNQKLQMDIDFEKLSDIYEDVQTVNTFLSKRIQAIQQGDASANAVISLHLLSCVIPTTLETALEELRHMFLPGLGQAKNNE